MHKHPEEPHWKSNYGLAFDKQGPEAVEDCENVIYTFRIRNDNCAAKPVDFLDELEDGMIWATDGLRILDAIRDNAEINDYEGSRTLDIKGLIVPGSTTLEFSVVAKFEEGLGAKFGLSNGQTKIFKNKAVINYKILKESLEVAAPPLYTNEIQTTVTINDDKPKRVSVKGFTISNSCYKEERVYSVNITIDNPNSYDITGTALEVGFNEEFNYQTNSVTSTNNLLTGATTDTSEDGSLLFENISIRPGESNISFKVKAPPATGLIQDIDENGNPVIDDKGNPVWVALGVSFDFYKETSSGVCEDNMLVDANGYKEIPYCLTKGCVISNINTTPTLIK